MTNTADFLIIGGGIAGLSAAARLAPHGRVLVLEAEEAPGYHSSGRSVTFSHFGIGGETVRALTAHSRAFFQSPPEGFDPLATVTPALFVATADMLPELDRLEAITRGLTDAVARLDEAGMAELCPALRFGDDAIVAGFAHFEGLKLDGHALLQGYQRAIRGHGGRVVTGARVARIAPRWRVETEAGDSFEAPVLIDAAGAWADGVAALAGVRPLGLTPLRRTIIAFDPPAGMDVRRWPFVKSAVDQFYMIPEAGRLLASPVDEEPDEPGDARPDDYGMALAAHRVTEFTSLEVRRIVHKWAGLRTFAPDRVPVAGWAPDAEGFFWLAGQGGYGLQTAPAMAEAVEALVLGRTFPGTLAAAGVQASMLAPGRICGQPA